MYIVLAAVPAMDKILHYFVKCVERGDKWPGPATLAEIARGLGIEPYDLLKPEGASSREVRKVVAKLARDISALVNESVKKPTPKNKNATGKA